LKRVGIIGCGAIGNIILEAIANRTIECDEVILFDGQIERAQKLANSQKANTTVVNSVDKMIQLKPLVIVEAASQQAVRQYAKKILAEEIELIIMSVGALLDLNLSSTKLHITSGAIGGIDAISSAALAGIEQATLTTRKNPEALEMNNQKEELVFEGKPNDAVKRFPKEMNVAATLALAAQPEKVNVRLISDPHVTRNVHEIKVKWKHGDMAFAFSNDPHPSNPKTSALAAWSAIRLLKSILNE
jgi:aspartate dehydrogenase